MNITTVKMCPDGPHSPEPDENRSLCLAVRHWSREPATDEQTAGEASFVAQASRLRQLATSPDRSAVPSGFHFYSEYLPLTGNAVAALFLSYCTHVVSTQADEQGWVRPTKEQRSAATGLTRTEQENARKLLRRKGLLEERMEGFPKSLAFRVTVAQKSSSGPNGIRHDVACSAAPVENTTPTSAATWNAYRAAYAQRYGVEPLRNAKVNSCLVQFVNRVGRTAAPEVAAFYVRSNYRWYVEKGHPVTLMLTDAEKLHTEWKRGQSVTVREAAEADRLQGLGNMWQELRAERTERLGHSLRAEHE